MRISTKHAAIIALWALVAVVGLTVLWVRFAGPGYKDQLVSSIGPGDYALTTTTGETFTEASLKGQPTAVFFGFTHCPEVCPTTLGDIATWQEELGDGNQLQVYFITVDPERDDVDTLRDYVSWAPGVQGVSGSREEIDEAIGAFRIFSRKVPLEGGDYTMDHSANVLLFDSKGRFFEPVGYQEPLDRVMDKLKRLRGA